MSAQQAWSLPSPWNAQDIGSPAIAGSASFNQGTFTINAAGSDIWGTSDQFSFIYQQVTGDVDVIARVDSVTAASAWSKSGVMIRSSLAANAAHGFALASAGKGVAFQRRLQSGGSSTNTSGPNVVPPRWVRLVRVGSRVSAYSSADGNTWSLIDSSTISLGATAYVGIATTSHNASAATAVAVSQVAVMPTSLPAPQQDVDIGAPAIKGSASYGQGVYTVHAGGTDIWGTSDQFNFVYQPMNGDVEVIARVRSLTGASNWSKTGVMIRETLNANSRHAFALASAASGYAFQRRPDVGGLSENTSGPAGAPPGWVRLVRTGSQIEAFQSADGKTWKSMGIDAIPMAANVFVGIATTSHKANQATDAVLDNVSIAALGSSPNQPPLAAITSPTDGSIFTAGTNIVVSAAASDSDGTVSKVDFFAGSTPLGSGSVTSAGYSVTWAAVPAGTYSLKAVAVDNDGASTTSATVSVRVDPPAANQPPIVSLTAPANNATYTAPASVTLNASASDSDGTISKVEFYNGATVLGTDTTSPYSYTWASVAAGTYTVTAKAYDNAGASTSSTSATITVANSTGNGLVGAYSLDEGTGSVAGNSSGTSPSGTITNATWTSGRFGQALSFTGNGEVNLGDVDFSGPFTVEGWFQTRSLYSGTCASFVMKARDYGFEVCGGQLAGAVAANSSWTAKAVVTLTSADLNAWKHAAMTYDGTSVRLYINGSLVSTVTGAHTTTNNMLAFGRWSMGAEYWNGLIDEVRLYNRALAQAEIQTDMNTPIGSGTGNRAPTATLTAPANNATFTAPATVTMSATASDSDGTVSKVEFYNGTTLLGTDATSPYSYSWPSVAAGTYTVKAVAYDNGGASTSSATSTITVNPANNQLPTVTLSTNGTTFTAPASVTLSATAADSDGTISKVEFYNGTTVLGTDTTSPYSFAWSLVPAGTYAVKAIAYDNMGASTTSAMTTITVSQPISTPPTGVVFTASPDHATLVTSYELRIYAAGANPNTATPIAISNLGKPTPDANNDITVALSSFFVSLAPGNYVAAVAAIGAGGSSVSTGVSFTR